MRVAAHRGFSEKYPANTMEAFRAALDAGADETETDVRVSADGELVLIHDETADRTTDGTGKICEMTLSELKKLDAGVKKGEEFAGAKIPTLRELFELVKDHPTMTLDLELKEYPIGDWEEKSFYTCDKIIEMVEEYDFSERCVINSFNQKLNEYVFTKYNGKYKQHLFYPKEILDLREINLPVYSF
jgi:glycerophosphoryl diester phosphodiesterase